MKTMIRQIAASILAAAVSVMLAACTIDGMDFHDTGSGEMASGGAHVEPCKVVDGSTIDTSVVECGVGLDLATFTEPSRIADGIRRQCDVRPAHPRASGVGKRAHRLHHGQLQQDSP